MKKLQDDHIDLNNDDFIYNNKYVEYSNEFIIGVEKTSITLKWYIEKYLIPNSRLEKLYGSVYCMGIERELTKEEEEFDYFCEVLRQYDDRKDIEEVKRSLKRNDGKEGISTWISNIFDIDVFDERYSIKERYKTLYLLYTIQKELNIELKVLFNKPAIENMDKRFVGMMNHNGALIGRIKDEFAKEVGDDVRKEINSTLLRVAREWKVLFVMLHQHLSVYDHDVCVNNLQRICNVTQKMVDFYRENSNIHEVKKEKYNLYERFYFELSTFEYIGMEDDIISINLSETDVDERIKDIFSKFDKTCFYKLISDYELFIEENLFNEIGKAIYRKDQLTSNEKRKLKSSAKLVSDIIGYIFEETDLTSDIMTYGLLLLIFCYVIFMDKKETIENRYYGYEKIYTVNTEVKHGKMAHDKAKIFIVQRIFNIYHYLRGFPNEIKLIRQIEMNIDFFMNIVFVQHGIEELLYVHAKLYRLVRPELFFDEQIIERENVFLGSIEKETGFKCIVLEKDSILYMIRMYFESKSMLEDIKNKAIDTVKRAHKTGKIIAESHELDMIDDDGYKSLSMLCMKANPKNKVLEFITFRRFC